MIKWINFKDLNETIKNYRNSCEFFLILKIKITAEHKFWTNLVIYSIKYYIKNMTTKLKDLITID